jgi:hypothetical protein
MENIANDRLKGASAIAEFIGESLRDTYHLLENKRIPAGKRGATWVASKTMLIEHYKRLTQGSAA